jgi:hypothetical protein
MPFGRPRCGVSAARHVRGQFVLAPFLCLANIASGRKSLTSTSPLGTLRAMRDVFRTGAGSAWSTRRDLLLETFALRHQLSVLVRSNRRFRPSDRLLWMFLRWWWPQWREALVLVLPATVDRWHREGFRRCWRRSGRPRIDSPCRDLIRRVAAENCLGRSADSRRITEARHRHFGTHGLAVSARSPDHTVTHLAYILREPLPPPNVHFTGDVLGCAR